MEQGGILDDSGRLDRRLRASDIFVPAWVGLKGTSIHWKFVTREYEREHPDRVRKWIDPVLKSEGGRNALASFVRLHEASDSDIERFAKEWGPLAFGEAMSLYLRLRKNVPRGPVRAARAMFGLPESVTTLGTGSLFEGGREPAELYRSLARYARAILFDAAEIHSGRLSASDWEQRFPYYCRDNPHGLEAAIDGVRLRISRFLEFANVSIGLEDGPQLRVEVQYAGILGLIATQVLLASANSAGIWQCDGCRELYVRAGKAPKNSTRNFCNDCRASKKAPIKSARQTYRRNIRRAKELANQGQTVEDIAKELKRHPDRVRKWIEMGVVA